MATPELTHHLTTSIGTNQDCAAAGFDTIVYLHPVSKTSIAGFIGRRNRKCFVRLHGIGETTLSTTAQAVAWVNRHHVRTVEASV